MGGSSPGVGGADTAPVENVLMLLSGDPSLLRVVQLFLMAQLGQVLVQVAEQEKSILLVREAVGEPLTDRTNKTSSSAK
jgi:hypothetical protein